MAGRKKTETVEAEVVETAVVPSRKRSTEYVSLQTELRSSWEN